MASDKKHYDWLKPTKRDWTLLVISLLFTIGATSTLQGNFDLSILCITFLGLGAIAMAATIIRKLRESKFDGVAVEVLGGVNIKPSRFRIIVLSGSLIILGLIMVTFGTAMPILLKIISWFILLTGLALTALLILGKIPVGFLRFDSKHFVIGKRRHSICIDWDGLERVEPGDVSGNSAVFIWLKSPEAIKTVPPTYQAAAFKEINTTERWLGAHFVIITQMFGFSGPILAGALMRYKEHPNAREELGKRYIE